MDKLIIALVEFTHVGGALIIVITLVSLLTGFMREYIPQDRVQEKLRKHEKWGPLLGALSGMLTPFCSASVVPVSMGMATMGVSLGTVLSFLISAPLCNFVVLAMVYATFGFKVTAIYLGLTLTSAVMGGWLITKTPWRDEIKRGAELEDQPVSSCSATPAVSACSAPAGTPGCSAQPVAACSAEPQAIPNASMACDAAATVTSATTTPDAEPSKTQNALRFALALFKRIIPYVLLGALISGVSAAYLPSEMVEKYVGGDNLLSILIAAVIGVPLYLRIEMAIPLLKVLIVKGMGLGPAMALIVGGTGASLPEIALVSSVLKPKAVVAFVGIVLLTAVVAGVLFQYVF
jgi:uncharacterized membrane protein YraQ (UPF0718 family)